MRPWITEGPRRLDGKPMGLDEAQLVADGEWRAIEQGRLEGAFHAATFAESEAKQAAAKAAWRVKWARWPELMRGR